MNFVRSDEVERIKQKLEADLAVARRIQQASLPTTLPKIPGYDLACSFEPADDAGGDAYDVVALDEQARSTLIYLADSTGHGVSIPVGFAILGEKLFGFFPFLAPRRQLSYGRLGPKEIY